MRSMGSGLRAGWLAIACLVAVTFAGGCGSGGGFGGGDCTFGTLTVTSDDAFSVVIDGVSYSLPTTSDDFTVTAGTHICSSAFVSATSVFVPGCGFGFFYAG
jgi:hypothetical protein